MFRPGDVVSYPQMCGEEGISLQRGMNFRLRHDRSLILMSLRKGAPYADRVEAGGKVLVYEGHNVPRTQGGPDPKKADQPEFYPSGRPTQNGLFCEAVRRFKRGESPPERVKVFEKIRAGIWVYNGPFTLTDVWQEESNGRKVFKFKLELVEELEGGSAPDAAAIEHDRVIPSAVKLEVWKRDKGRCVVCGSQTNLHFDHDIPYSQGGSSRDARNIQILCAKHNLAKHDRIV